MTARTKKGKTPSDYGKVITDEVKVHSNSNNKNNAEVPKPKENLKNCEVLTPCTTGLLFQPFSFAELARLIDTSEQWDDTVLLCGRTGAGKSTTINFLAGCLSSPKLGENLRAKSSSGKLNTCAVLTSLDNSDAYDDWYASVNGTRPIGKSLNVVSDFN